MELKNVILVLVDISGYTKFINKRTISLIHAEEIITALLESVINKAEYPLILNKLEGDAAFLYAVIQEDISAQSRSTLLQTLAFFEAFNNKIEELSTTAATCSCDACEHLGNLKLKAILHTGEVAVKKIRTFEELAGEPVIILHRLLKNSVRSSEYLLITKQYFDLVDQASGITVTPHTEVYEDVGRIESYVYFPHARPALPRPETVSTYTKIKTNTIRHFSLALQFSGLKKPKLSLRHKRSHSL